MTNAACGTMVQLFKGYILFLRIPWFAQKKLKLNQQDNDNYSNLCKVMLYA